MKLPAVGALALMLIAIAPDAGAIIHLDLSSAAPSLVYADGTFVLSSPLHVPPGARVVVRNATLLLDYRCACDTPQVLVEGGVLQIRDSTLTTSLDTPWRGLAEAAGLDASGATFERYSLFEMTAGGDGASIRASTFRDATGPFTFSRGTFGSITHSRFLDSTRAVMFHDASGELIGNTFTNIHGPGRTIDLESSIAGEKAYETRVRVVDNVIQDSYWGLVSINGFESEFVGNTFRNMTSGMTIGVAFGDEFLHTASPIVERNRFEGNLRALTIGASGQSDSLPVVTVRVRDNAFVGNANVEIEALPHPDALFTVDATGNWWGSDAGPQHVRGPVLVAPWLSADPTAK